LVQPAGSEKRLLSTTTSFPPKVCTLMAAWLKPTALRRPSTHTERSWLPGESLSMASPNAAVRTRRPIRA